MTHRIELFFLNLFSIWLTELKSFSIWLKELNLSCFPVWLKEVNLLNMTQRIEFFWTWLKRIEPSSFWSMTQRIELFFFGIWPKELIFLWLTESNHLFEDDSKNRPHFFERNLNWTFVEKNRKWTFFLKNSKISHHFQKNRTQRIEPFFCFEKNNSNDWSFFIWLKELNPFLNMTHRIDFFFFEIRIRLTELNLFSLIWLFFSKESNNWNFQYDSKNWTSFYEPLFNMTQRDEVFFQIDSKSCTHFFPWLKEITLFLQNDAQNWILILSMTQRMEPLFFEYDAKNWTLCLKRLGELNFREKIAPSFFELDSKNWTFFLNWLKEWNFVKTIQTIELFSSI